MTNNLSTRSASLLWIVLLTAASLATTLALACATPFAALAALAAVHMRRRDGIALMLLAWLASQLVGFLVLHYPHDVKTLCWGAGLGSAAIGALLGAALSLSWVDNASVAVRLAVAYLAGFVAFKAVVLVWALFLGGVAITLDPVIMLRQLFRDGAILIGLYALYRGLIALGVPAPRHMLANA
jgi:hypothetical protein